MLKFAVLGYGVVGSGVVELFYKNKSKIEKKAGRPMDVKYILDIREFLIVHTKINLLKP